LGPSLFFERFITVEQRSIIYGIVEDVKMNRRQSQVADGLIMLDEPLKSRIFGLETDRKEWRDWWDSVTVLI